MFERFNDGGIFMYVILILALVTLGFVVERALALFKNIKLPPNDFRKQLVEHLRHGNIKTALSYAASQRESALGRIAELGCYLRAHAGGEEEIQSRMDECLTEEISRIDKRTGFLAMFGNVATLLGLLGTISGMIHSFAAVSNASPVDRATLLSKGISEAMNCTAFGLIVAIPALVAFAVYQNRSDRLIHALTQGTTQVYHDLLFLTGSTDSARSYAAPQDMAEAAHPTPHAASNTPTSYQVAYP